MPAAGGQAHIPVSGGIRRPGFGGGGGPGTGHSQPGGPDDTGTRPVGDGTAQGGPAVSTAGGQAAPQNIQRAIDELEANAVASSTRRSLDSRIKFWLKVAAANGVEPWPLGAGGVPQTGRLPVGAALCRRGCLA